MSWKDILIAKKKGIVAGKEDLANYLPNKGTANLNGSFIAKNNEAAFTTVAVVNSLRDIGHQLGSTGAYMIYDTINDKEILKSTADGTNTFNGTASGNLPLDGGGTVKKASMRPMSVENISSGATASMMGFRTGSLGDIGFIGMYGKDNPAWITADQSKAHALYHAGNITSGTSELTAGTSALPTGHIYIQYE